MRTITNGGARILGKLLKAARNGKEATMQGIPELTQAGMQARAEGLLGELERELHKAELEALVRLRLAQGRELLEDVWEDQELIEALAVVTVSALVTIAGAVIRRAV